MSADAADGDRYPVAAITATLAIGLAGLFAGMLLGALGISLLDAAVGLGFEGAVPTAVGTALQGVGLVAVAVLYLRSRDLPPSYLRISWPTAREIGWIGVTTVSLFAVLGVLLVGLQQFDLAPTEHSVVVAAEDSPELLLPLIPLSILVTGPAEELLYRGVVQTRLRESFGAVRAVAVAAAVFAAVHVPAYGVGVGLGPELLTTLGVLLVLGGVLGAVYEYTGNLVVPAAAHGLYNATVFANQYLVATGGGVL